MVISKMYFFVLVFLVGGMVYIMYIYDVKP